MTRVIHKLTNIDEENHTAICSVCGPADIYITSQGRLCATRIRERNAIITKERREEYLKTPRKAKPRVYRSLAHILSDIRDDEKTATCSVCGPVRMYVSSHSDGKYVTRRCAKANGKGVAVAKEARRSSNRVFLDEYKTERGCAKCGYNSSPLGLDLHHRDPAEKDLQISGSSSYSRERLLQELEKCDVLCAICHRLIHEELGWIN